MKAAFYKDARPGVAGIYNRLVAWWTKSPYSHVELIVSSGRAWSASFEDGGVRSKLIEFDPKKWDVIDVPAELEPAAVAWFTAHRGEKYDLLGNLQFIVAAIPNSEKRWFCSEAVAAALGIPDPWRYDPGTLASALTLLNRPAASGFFNAQ